MAQNKKTEFLVIGGGLAGLTITAALAKASRHVVCLEAGDTWGGQARATVTPFGRFEYGFKYLPYVPASPEALGVFESVMGLPLQTEVITKNILTFHKNQFVPFIGFGETAPVGIEALQYYLNPQSMECRTGPAEWVDRLSDAECGTRILKACVTKIEVVQTGKRKQARTVEVNGQEIWEGEHIIYCGPLRELPHLLGAEHLGNKQAQKIAGKSYWTAVSLDLVMHRPLEKLALEDGTERPLPLIDQSLFLLSGGTQPFQAQVGQFLSAIHSQWLTFVPFEFVQNDELSATALKEMKRQIGRAFGKDFMAQVAYERIVVSPGSHGDVHLKLAEYQKLPEVTNISVISPFLKAPYNIVGLGLQIGEVLEGLVSSSDSDLSVAPPV